MKRLTAPAPRRATWRLPGTSSCSVVAARPPHLLYISVVGTDKVPFGYFKAKAAAEEGRHRVEPALDAPAGHPVLRFILSGAKNMSRLSVVVVSKDFRCQPVHPADVADMLAGLVLRQPAGRVPDVGGPEVSTWAEMVRQYVQASYSHLAGLPGRHAWQTRITSAPGAHGTAPVPVMIEGPGPNAIIGNTARRIARPNFAGTR